MVVTFRDRDEAGRLWSSLKLVDSDDTLADLEKSNLNETLAGILAYTAFAYVAYRGYKRNNSSLGYGALWGLGGGAFPIPAVLATLFIDKGFKW